MKVIFYIGHHKVGSTALQAFLTRNWRRLAKNGTLYPAVESRGFAANLARALGQPGEGDAGDVNIREPHSALAYKMMSEVSARKVPPQFKRLPAAGQMLLAIQNQVRSIRPDNLVLCSEAFANFGEVDTGLIETLAKTFPKASFEIYCALRRPDEYLISWHGQRLKVGEKVQALSAGGAEAYFNNIHFNFRSVVEPWVTHLPGARLILRSYADILAAGGSEQDFMDQTGLELAGKAAPPAGRQANLSLPRAAMEIVRRANHELPPEQAHALSQFLLKGEGLTPAPNRDVEMFGAPLRALLAERFAPVHDYLSGLAGKPFFADYAGLTETLPIPEAQATAALLEQIDPDTLPRPEPWPELGAYLAGLRREMAA